MLDWGQGPRRRQHPQHVWKRAHVLFTGAPNGRGFCAFGQPEATLGRNWDALGFSLFSRGTHSGRPGQTSYDDDELTHQSHTSHSQSSPPSTSLHFIHLTPPSHITPTPPHPDPTSPPHPATPPTTTPHHTPHTRLITEPTWKI